MGVISISWSFIFCLIDSESIFRFSKSKWENLHLPLISWGLIDSDIFGTLKQQWLELISSVILEPWQTYCNYFFRTCIYFSKLALSLSSHAPKKNSCILHQETQWTAICIEFWAIWKYNKKKTFLWGFLWGISDYHQQ